MLSVANRRPSIGGTAIGLFAAGGAVRDVLDDHASMCCVAISLGAWLRRIACGVRREFTANCSSSESSFQNARVALPARPAAETVTDLAHIYRESLGPVRIQHANVVTRRAGDDLVDALPRTYQPVSSDWLRGSRPCALLSRPQSRRQARQSPSVATARRARLASASPPSRR
jgi:hypothetical protein